MKFMSALCSLSAFPFLLFLMGLLAKADLFSIVISLLFLSCHLLTLHISKGLVDELLGRLSPSTLYTVLRKREFSKECKQEVPTSF